MILYVNACVRNDSRTDRLARYLLSRLGDYKEVKLSEEKLQPLSRDTLDKRAECIEKGDYSDAMFSYAKEFASADIIVVSAPYWDLSFPSILKIYFENIYVTGIVSRYTAQGRPQGLCRAKVLYYVTTAGGPYVPDFSYGYIERLAVDFLGIGDTKLISAQMLDVDGSDCESILTEAEKCIDKMLG